MHLLHVQGYILQLQNVFTGLPILIKDLTAVAGLPFTQVGQGLRKRQCLCENSALCIGVWRWFTIVDIAASFACEPYAAQHVQWLFVML